MAGFQSMDTYWCMGHLGVAWLRLGFVEPCYWADCVIAFDRHKKLDTELAKHSSYTHTSNINGYRFGFDSALEPADSRRKTSA
ncbi:MAG: hypothetical protein HOK97_23975 [Deltaproteobacteria bacterium]|nr:hypothetical protein [Deltaproteobacteria bacterium]